MDGNGGLGVLEWCGRGVGVLLWTGDWGWIEIVMAVMNEGGRGRGCGEECGRGRGVGVFVMNSSHDVTAPFIPLPRTFQHYSHLDLHTSLCTN